MSLVGALNKIGAAYKKTAPFHSAVDEALANLARQKGTGDEFLRELSKIPGVKPAELLHRKLDTALKAKGKITKDEAMKLARENPPPQLHENVSQDLTDKQLTKKADEIAQDFGYDSYYEMPHDLQRQADERLEAIGSQYGQYQLPGGENYREIKMKLPSFTKEDSDKLMELEAYKRRASYPEQWGKMTGENKELADLQAKKASMSDPYLSSHWRGEPNVLAHMRVQDRAGPNGEKILHVEEIQSDWHQEGRKRGYASEDKPIRLSGEVIPLGDKTYGVKWQDGSVSDVGLGFDHAQRLADKGKLTGVVPDAPFKKNWHELAMKRLMNYAADNGYDSIAITPGAEQAKRYDLSKQVDELLYKQNPDGTFQLSAQARGMGNMIGDAIPVEKLEDYVGKDVAQKIIGGEGKTTEVAGKYNPESMTSSKDYMQSLSGIDLQVGGEGMKGFYDQMLPAYLNQFGKKYGAQVEMNKMPVSTRDPDSISWGGGQGDHPFITSSDINEPYDGMVDLLRRNPDTGEETLVGRMLRADSERHMAQELQKLDTVNQTKLHHFPITPEMREEIATKGFPLYQKGGTVNIEQEYKLKKLRK